MSADPVEIRTTVLDADPAAVPDEDETSPGPTDAEVAPLRVCVVCAGNICRSPMAEIVLRAKLAAAGLGGQVVVDSAGTGPWQVGRTASDGARRALTLRGYDTAHRARQFDPAWFAERDLVLALDVWNARDLRRVAPDAESAAKVSMLGAFANDEPGPGGGDLGDREEWSVPDPYGLPDRAFKHALDLIERASDGLVRALQDGRIDRPAGDIKMDFETIQRSRGATPADLP